VLIKASTDLKLAPQKALTLFLEFSTIQVSKVDVHPPKDRESKIIDKKNQNISK